MALVPVMVYVIHMAHNNIDIDDKACAEVMRRYRLKTKREAVNFAVRAAASEALGVEEARQMRGAGWEGDLDEMRAERWSSASDCHAGCGPGRNETQEPA